MQAIPITPDEADIIKQVLNAGPMTPQGVRGLTLQENRDRGRVWDALEAMDGGLLRLEDNDAKVLKGAMDSATIFTAAAPVRELGDKVDAAAAGKLPDPGPPPVTS